MTIGERIKARREELGMSVTELAERLGKNRATVYRYENGDIKEMPTPVLEPLAKVLGVTPAELMGWPVAQDNEAPEESEPSKPGYYTDPETARLAQEMFEDPDMRILYSMKRDMDPQTFRDHMEFMRKTFLREHPERGDDFDGC